jgi:hypothetical protein
MLKKKKETTYVYSFAYYCTLFCSITKIKPITYIVLEKNFPLSISNLVHVSTHLGNYQGPSVVQ